MLEKSNPNQDIVKVSTKEQARLEHESSEKYKREREIDLATVKKEGCANYPRVQKILNSNSKAFDAYYRKYWDPYVTSKDERRWGALQRMEENEAAIEERDKEEEAKQKKLMQLEQKLNNQ